MSYFTIKRSFGVVPSVDVLKEFEKIDRFLEILEKSDVGKNINYVKHKNKKCKGRNGYNPYNLFATIIYCFAKFKGSLRDIEDKCRFDIRVNYLMEGNLPDHSVIGDFINDYILPYHYKIFTKITKQIILELKLNITNTYLDGTKFEANANKYKFVWKPTKYHQKLDIKIKEFLVKIGCDYQSTEKNIKTHELNQILKDYADKHSIDIYNLPSGRGCRYTKEQKIYKEGHVYLLKLLEYEEKEEICGENRNSYYKTDKDATAMVLKEDYYSKLSNDFHAGYNVQAIVSSLLILMYGVYQDRADYYTLIPMLDNFKNYYGFYPSNMCADSGYGIYSNYLYLKEHKIGNYVKFQSWKGEASGKRPQLFKLDNNNNILCLNNIIGKEYKTRTHPKMQDGKFYIWNGCNSCEYAYKCKAHMKEEQKENDFRIREFSINYELFKQEARDNLLSVKGIELRINRSIQIEGTFGQIKQNMNYERIRRRGLDKVSCEIMLECLGVNVRRLLSSFEENKFKENCWDTPSDLQPEIFKSVKPKEKKLSKN